MLQTRSQRFAKDAHEKVTQIKQSCDKGQKEKYKAMTRNLPVLIRTAGLAQALAFVETEPQELLRHLSETVNGGQSLSAACRTKPLYDYMRLTRDTVEALLWYKRFAESLLETDDKANKQTNTGQIIGEKQ